MLDLLVLGGGTAALAAARTARRRDARVAMVTEGPPGGECTFTGCVPSKTLLAGGALGWERARDRMRDTVRAIAADEDEDVLAGEGIQVVRGRGCALDPTTVQVGARYLRGRRLVVATGSVPAVPGVVATVPHLTNETIFALEDLPGRLLVLGGGPIGCELSQAFRRLGSDVVLIESAPRLLSREEPQASAVVEQALRRAGVDVRTGATARSSRTVGGGVELDLEGGPVHGTHLLVAVGRAPRAHGLAPLGLATDARGYIAVDDRMRTSVPGVYAAGDAVGRLQLTHAADEMARVAAGNALRSLPWQRYREDAVPWVTFTDPEVARVGLSEDQAAQRVRGAVVVELPMGEVDRARTAARTEGFVKVVLGPHPMLRGAGGGRVLGATVVAPRAGEMIAELALAVRTGMLAGRLAQTSHAYPTWSTAVQQAVAQAFGVGSRRPRPAQRG